MKGHEFVLLVLVLFIVAVALEQPAVTGQATYGIRTASVRLDPVESATPRALFGLTGWAVKDPVDALQSKE